MHCQEFDKHPHLKESHSYKDESTFIKEILCRDWI